MDGTYSGQISFSNNCASGSSTTRPTLSLTLKQSGATVNVGGYACNVTGTVDQTNANSVTLNAVSCPADAKGNKLGLMGGSIELNDGVLVIDLFTSDTLADGSTCSGSIGGQLPKVTGGQPATWNPYP